MASVFVVGAAIVSRGKCLIARRADKMSLAGKWEFPGGKIERGETPEAALVREIREELGLEIVVHDHLASGTAQIGAKTIELSVYGAVQRGGELALHEHAQIAWVSAADFDRFDWAEADIPVLDAVQGWMATRGE